MENSLLPHCIDVLNPLWKILYCNAITNKQGHAITRHKQNKTKREVVFTIWLNLFGSPDRTCITFNSEDSNRFANSKCDFQHYRTSLVIDSKRWKTIAWINFLWPCKMPCRNGVLTLQMPNFPKNPWTWNLNYRKEQEMISTTS